MKHGRRSLQPPPCCGHPVAGGWELTVSGAICLKPRVRPTHYHYHYHYYYYYFHPHLLARRYSLRHLTRHLHIAVDCKCRDRRAAASDRRRSTTLCGEGASSELVPLDACSLRSNPTVSEHYSSSTLLLCGDSRWQAGFANRQYSKLLRQHRQWCPPAGLVRDRY